jgi:hypothetical protein
MAITEHSIREELGLGQLLGRHARSIMAAQRVRQEALETLLPAVWDDPTARQAVVEVCKDHPDAGFWLRHRRGFNAPASGHWPAVLREELDHKVKQLTF